MTWFPHFYFLDINIQHPHIGIQIQETLFIPEGQFIFKVQLHTHLHIHTEVYEIIQNMVLMFHLSHSVCVFQGWSVIWWPLSTSHLTIGEHSRLNDFSFSFFPPPISFSPLYLRICSGAQLSTLMRIKFITPVCLYLGHSLNGSSWFGWARRKWNAISTKGSFTWWIWRADSKESNEISMSLQTAGCRLCLLISIIRPESPHTNTKEACARKEKWYIGYTSSQMLPPLNVISFRFRKLSMYSCLLQWIMSWI